jgi:MoxR-like ATPase
MPTEVEVSEQDRGLSEQDRGALLNFLFGAPVERVALADAEEVKLGYVETGDTTVAFLEKCIRNGRHAMLVGPRGTGKSYMGAKAVLRATAGGKVGVVQRIEIQGDPNKPPSDYFDDSISFDEVAGRLVPSIINAPFFRLARRGKGKSKNKFKCYPGEENRIILKKRNATGRLVEVDRVVIYWDEGNRSSPAMLNAVLGLLAEGRIRRDGISYAFPPISCILTRNPDGYDANSAKMPSPLIDRFGVQFYVYNPSMLTFVGIIAPEFIRRQRTSLLREVVVAAGRVASPVVTDWNTTYLVPALENAEKPDSPSTDSDLIAALETANDSFVNAAEPAIRKLPAADIDSGKFVSELWARVLRVPVDGPAYRRVAARLAMVVLATWGNLRSVKDKPGMQYLPPAMKLVLAELAKKDPSVKAHLSEVGDLTRYGTSIRAFEEMLKALLIPLLDAGKGDPDALEGVGMADLRKQLGALLSHRCETTFNPDREPSKALRKSRSLLWLAEWILADCRAKEIVALTGLKAEVLNPASSVPRYQGSATTKKAP